MQQGLIWRCLLYLPPAGQSSPGDSRHANRLGNQRGLHEFVEHPALEVPGRPGRPEVVELAGIFLEEDRLSNGEFMGGMEMCRFVAEMLTKATGTKYDYVKPKPTYRTWFVHSITPFVIPKPSGPKPLVFPAK